MAKIEFRGWRNEMGFNLCAHFDDPKLGHRWTPKNVVEAGADGTFDCTPEERDAYHQAQEHPELTYMD